MKYPAQMTLGQTITRLEQSELTYDSNGKRHDKYVTFDFGGLVPSGLSSWRGEYAELAINFTGGTYEDREVVTALKFLERLKEAVGKKYTGWKGGEFMMTETTPLWVDNDGCYTHTALVGVDINEYGVTLRTWKLDTDLI